MLVERRTAGQVLVSLTLGIVLARLRIGNDIRVFYDVVENEVQVLGIVPKPEVAAWLERYGERDEKGGTV